jgi:pilus assembly protein Flp/PilA
MLRKWGFFCLKNPVVLCKMLVSQETFLGNPAERRYFPMLFAPKEKGQGLVEYALILVLVAIVVIAALMILGPLIGNVFSTINSSLSSF